MNNHEAVVEVLRQAREARQWTDEAVASELLTQLGLDPSADAKKATVTRPDDAPAPDSAGPVTPSTHPLDRAPGTLGPNEPLVPAPPPGTPDVPEPPNVSPPQAPSSALEAPIVPEPEPEPVLESSKKAKAKAADEAGNSDAEQDAKRK